MACKYKCGDESVDDKFACRSCLVQRQEFKWCVITKIPPEGVEGNTCDDVVLMDSEGDSHPFAWDSDPSVRIARTDGLYPVQVPRQVFSLGEVFAVDPDFRREIGGKGRKPGKWDVDAEHYDAHDYQGALLKAIEVLTEEEKRVTLQYEAEPKNAGT